MVDLTIKVEVEKVSPQPGDLLVVRVAPDIQLSHARALHDDLIAILPGGVRVVVIPRGVEFSVLSDGDLAAMGLQRTVTP